MLIIGTGTSGRDFARKVRDNKDYGYNVVGYLHDRVNDKNFEKVNNISAKNNSIIGEPVLGDYSMLPKLLEESIIDEVVIALPFDDYNKYRNMLEICEKAGTRVRIIPDFSAFLSPSSKFEEFDGIPLLNVRYIPLDDPLNSLLKRICDILVSSAAIILTTPLMIFIAVGIKITSKGPIFFKQERIGQNNRPFYMLKFRSMRVATDNSASTVWTTVNDPRKTKFGSFLRKTSLDELPQFFNVLCGNMSVTGPRPERPFFVDQFKEEVPKYMVKHQVKPGITGWAQVNGWRGDTCIKKRVECDLYYIENWDLLFDIKIMLLTLFKGVVNKNAY